MNKRQVLAFLIPSTLGAYCGSQSRVPDLNVKANLGDEVELSDPFSFEVLVVASLVESRVEVMGVR